MKRQAWLLLSLTVAAAAFAVAPARAGGAREMIVCYPGKPGSTQAGQNTMDTLADYLAQKAGFEAKSLHATYFNDEKKATDAFKSKKPLVGILSLAVYLKWRKAGEKLAILAQSERDGKLTDQYHLFVPASSKRRSLADMKGAVIASNHLQDKHFASKIVFGGEIDAEDVAAIGSASGLVGVVTTDKMLPAIRALADRKPLASGAVLDGILFDDEQLQTAAALPQIANKQLVEIWTSRPLPTPPVVSFTENADKAETAKLAEALTGMAKDPEGKAILATIQATGFGPAAPENYAQVESSY